MTILGVLKLAGGCPVPCSQWRKFGGPCTLPSGQVQQPWLSFAKGVPPAPSDVRPVPLLTPAPTARGGSLGIGGPPKHGLQGPGRVCPWQQAHQGTFLGGERLLGCSDAASRGPLAGW